MSEYTRCGACGQRIRVNADGTLRVHQSKPKGVPRYERPTCIGSGMTVAD